MDSTSNVSIELNSIGKTLEKHNMIVQNILDFMQKPESKVTIMLEKFVLIAGVLGILNAAEIIRIWLTGGK